MFVVAPDPGLPDTYFRPYATATCDTQQNASTVHSTFARTGANLAFIGTFSPCTYDRKVFACSQIYERVGYKSATALLALPITQPYHITIETCALLRM